MSKIKFAEIISTVCYIGNSKYCPGTLGSIVGILLFPCLILFSGYCLPDIYTGFFDISFYCIIILIFLFILGAYTSNIYSRHINIADPKQIIIDEVVGQLLTIMLCIPIFFMPGPDILHELELINFIMIIHFIAPFILFRFFDILKPWPINWVDKNIKGGIGIMLDDIIAAIFAATTEYAIIFFIIVKFNITI